MKRLSVLLGALLLPASAALADDFVYLKCKTTIHSVVWNWTKTKELNKWISQDDVLYKIDTKNEELFSSNLEIAIQYEPQHPGLLVGQDRFQAKESPVKIICICNTNLQER